MTRFIDGSEGIVDVKVAMAWRAPFCIRCYHRRGSTKYYPEDIARMLETDEDIYRNAGKAAAGAIVGGVLTGGIGLLAGAAFGGRRRRTSSFLVMFRDGAYVAFEEPDANLRAVLKTISDKHKVRDLVKAERQDDSCIHPALASVKPPTPAIEGEVLPTLTDGLASTGGNTRNEESQREEIHLAPRGTFLIGDAFRYRGRVGRGEFLLRTGLSTGLGLLMLGGIIVAGSADEGLPMAGVLLLWFFGFVLPLAVRRLRDTKLPAWVLLVLPLLAVSPPLAALAALALVVALAWLPSRPAGKVASEPVSTSPAAA